MIELLIHVFVWLAHDFKSFSYVDPFCAYVVDDGFGNDDRTTIKT